MAAKDSPVPPRGDETRQPAVNGFPAGCHVLGGLAILAGVAVALAALLGLIELLNLT